MITYRLSQSASNRTGNEVLIFAKDVKFKESMSYLTDALKI